MANATDKQAVFEQALTDAGCSEQLKELCCECYEEHDGKRLEKLLAEHRKALLDNVHKGEAQIDCLDYLTYTLKKNS